MTHVQQIVAIICALMLFAFGYFIGAQVTMARLGRQYRQWVKEFFDQQAERDRAAFELLRRKGRL